MASGLPTENYGRGMRQIRRSQRAKEADSNVAGLQNLSDPSTSANSLAPQDLSATPCTPHSVYSPAMPTSGDRVSIAMAPGSNTDDNHNADHVILAQHQGADVPSLQSGSLIQQAVASIESQSQNTGPLKSRDVLSAAPPMKEESSECQRRKTADSVQPTSKAERVTKPQKSRKKKSTARVPTDRRRPATPNDNIQNFMTKDQLLQPAKLQIYRWDHPIPKDFLNLSDELKAAKARVDAAEGENDLDPELDDWHEACGLESDLFPDLKVKSSVGLTFISRAKRAYRAGRTWASFEVEELAIDSRAGARSLTDEHERAIALSSSLSNTFRLYVFEQIKVRLCHEIWLQPYPDPDEMASLKDSAIGTFLPTPASSDKTALGLAVQRLDSLPERVRTMVPGTALLIRTRAELPGKDREVHQPEGPPIRATQRNMRGLGTAGRAFANGEHLDMQTSGEE